MTSVETTPPASAHTTQPQAQPLRAAMAAFLGTSIEWYDFFIYSTAAALVFADIFFSTENRLIALLASLGTFAAGYIARPFGAAIFGHLGDKIGRKKSLIVTLIMMGGGSTLIGFLPTYHSIGATATVFLIILRIVQGLAVGGEWGGAVLISAEHSPPKWRTFLASVPQYGSSAGLILSTGVFTLVSNLEKEAFLTWGWRIPFLLSAVLLLIAYAIRAGVNESPEMAKQLEQAQDNDLVPLREIIKYKRQSLICGILTCVMGVAGFQFTITLMMSYTVDFLHIEKNAILDVVFWVGFVEAIGMLIGTALGTRFGSRKVLLASLIAMLLWAIPMMLLVSSANKINIAIAIQVLSFLNALNYGVLPSYLINAFPVRMRYTGISLSYQLCSAIFAGTTPIIGVWLAHFYDGSWIPLACLLIFLVIATLIGTWFLTSPKDETTYIAPHTT